MKGKVMGVAGTVEVSSADQPNAKTHSEMLLSWTRLPSPSINI